MVAYATALGVFRLISGGEFTSEVLRSKVEEGDWRVTTLTDIVLWIARISDPWTLLLLGSGFIVVGMIRRAMQ
jgi:hypothetical protein